jgi:hypothetical protein
VERVEPAPVDLKKTLRELEMLARKLGAKVRYESMGLAGGDVGIGRGGICRVGGRTVILCEEHLPLVDKVSVLAEAIVACGVVPIHLPRPLRLRLQRRIARLVGTPPSRGA